jgi:sugar phosphate isomerase/epimerase
MKRKIAVQLYTVREALGKDFLGTLKEVAAIGYKGVEMAGVFGGMTGPELRKVMDDLGLSVISGHIGPNALGAEWEKTLDFYSALGAKYLGLAYVGNEHRTAEGIPQLCAMMNEAAVISAQRGITFIYHNHNFEFDTRIGDKSMFDLLYEGTDPNSVAAELDCYWARISNQDPIAVIKQLNGRAKLIHVKDMTADRSRFFEIVGNGVIDYGPIMAAADAHGADWYVVEQDQSPRGELFSIRASWENLHDRGWA